MLTELQILKQLKESYDKHLVSALVGSGFTKNMYPKAPSWNELLKDLVMFAYDSELHDKYEDYCHKTRTRTKQRGSTISICLTNKTRTLCEIHISQFPETSMRELNNEKE